MYEGFDIWMFLAGFPLAIAIALVLIFIGWRKGKKKCLFDERYTRIHQHARSISWIATTFTILIAWVIVIIVEGPRLAFFLLAGIWIVHMLSYSVGGAIANRRN